MQTKSFFQVPVNGNVTASDVCEEPVRNLTLTSQQIKLQLALSDSVPCKL